MSAHPQVGRKFSAFNSNQSHSLLQMTNIIVLEPAGIGLTVDMGFLLYILLLLPAATKLGQGHVFTRVYDSVNRGGSASVHAGIPPPGADTPQEQTPRSRHTPPGADTPPAYECESENFSLMFEIFFFDLFRLFFDLFHFCIHFRLVWRGLNSTCTGQRINWHREFKQFERMFSVTPSFPHTWNPLPPRPTMFKLVQLGPYCMLPPRPLNMLILVHCVDRGVGKRAVGILLKCLLVSRSISCLNWNNQVFSTFNVTCAQKGENMKEQDWIRVGCIPPAWQPYVFRPPDVCTSVGRILKWTSWWPPDANSRGLRVPCVMSGGVDGGDWTVRSNATWAMVMWGPLPYQQTDTSENITFPQLRLHEQSLPGIISVKRTLNWGNLRRTSVT